MTVKFSNYASTTLLAQATASATTLVVADSIEFPTLVPGDWFYATLIDQPSYATQAIPPAQVEVVKVTSVSGNSWTVARAQDGTTGQIWAQGSIIECRLVAAALNDFGGLLPAGAYLSNGSIQMTNTAQMLSVNVQENGTSVYLYGGFTLAYAITAKRSYFIGTAGNLSQTGTDNMAMGSSAAPVTTTGSSNIAIGSNALLSTTTGNSNTAVGVNAAANAPTAGNVTAVGAAAAINNTASGTTAIGASAAAANAAGSGNTAVGYQAAMANTANATTALGYQALAANTTGADNTAVGTTCMVTNTTGANNTAVGESALNANVSGNNNAAFGENTLLSNTGSSSAAFGTEALQNATSGGNNVAVGYRAGFAGTPVVGGSALTLVGYQAQCNGAAYTNSAALGASAIVTQSNQIVLGNSSISLISAQVTSITGISDRHLKHDIADCDLGLDFIVGLKPVIYRYNTSHEVLRYGFVAQDVEKSLGADILADEMAMVSRGPDGTLRMAYTELIAPLVRAIQEQQQQIADLTSRLAVAGIE